MAPDSTQPATASAPNIEGVIRRVQDYAPGADIAVLEQAWNLADWAHRDQRRKNGEPYIIHPLNVAWILTELRMDVDTIACGLLHDTVEDTEVTKDEIEGKFGKTVAEMVDGVTKLSKLAYRGKVEEQAENFRKLVLAFGRDPRVLLVKTADRLHNMRTLEFQRPEKQKLIARETLDIYAPLAARLGIDVLKRELEDLCFRYLWPEEFVQLEDALKLDEPDRDAYVSRTITLIRETLAARGMVVEVTGRAKHLYSIWKKLQKNGRDLNDLYDLLAFRVTVTDRDACYVTLGFLHAAFLPVPERMKDYIAVPKANGYQSLHTTVVGPGGRTIEIQIRTPAMHRVAETGIASHWRYKSGRLAVSSAELQEIARLRGVIQMAREIEDPADFIEAARSDLAASIHVFTPRKDVILLPEGATALDFAYYVHTEVGNRCAGVKVNGRLVPLRTPVKTGDTVEVITRPDARPTRDWLEWAKTHRAIEKIRKRLRDQLADRGVEMGREILDAALRKVGSAVKKLQGDKEVAERLKAAGFADLDALCEHVLSGQKTPSEALRIILPPAEPKPAQTVMQSLLGRFQRAPESAIVVSGITDILVDYARCCRPLKGEPIIGYVTRGRGISVHKAECPMVKGLDTDRLVPVVWDAGVRTEHRGRLRVIVDDKPGMLAAISGVCKSADINLWDVATRNTDAGQTVIDLGVLVHDFAELDGLTRRLRAVKGVESVDRVG